MSHQMKLAIIGTAITICPGIWCFSLTNDPVATALAMCAFGSQGIYYSLIFWPWTTTGGWTLKTHPPSFYLPTEIYLKPFFFISFGSKIFLPSTILGSFIFNFIFSKSTTLNSGHSVTITKQSVSLTEFSKLFS